MALLKDGTRIYGNVIVDGNIAVSEIYSGGNTWTFGNDGTLTFPAGNLTINPGIDYFGSQTTLIASADGTSLISQSSGSNSAIASIWIEKISDPFNGNVAAMYANPIPGSGVVRVTTGNLALGTNIWDFGTDGNLTLPANGAINSVGNSSGDGNGFSTLQLVPDLDQYSFDQYLIIDPTAPSHIHIRAGGTQDGSAAQLILGGETSHVMVGAGLNPDISVAANSNTWVFSGQALFSMPAIPSATLTTIVSSPGSLAVVSDSTPAGRLAFWDGTNSRWSYVSDNSAV